METELRAVNSQAIESVKYNLGYYVEGMKKVMQEMKSRMSDSSPLEISKAQVDWYTSPDIKKYQQDFFTTCLKTYFDEVQEAQIEQCVSLIHGYEALLARVLLGIPIQVVEEADSLECEHSLLALEIINRLLYFRKEEFYPQHLAEIFQDKKMQPTTTRYCCFNWPNTSIIEYIQRNVEGLYTSIVVNEKKSLFSKRAKVIDEVCQKHLSKFSTEVLALASKESEINEVLYSMGTCHNETTPLLLSTPIG